MLKYIRAKIFDSMVDTLSRRGFTVMSEKQISNTTQLYREVSSLVNSNKILSIVFSKDRAMQLNAFLKSYYSRIINPSPITILYKATSEEHFKSYEDLKLLFSDREVIFIEETEFRNQLIEIIKSTDAKRIIFYVDDMIFTHEFDYSNLYDVDAYKNILSFTRGKDLTYSTVLERTIELPKFVQNGVFLSFDWDEVEYSDWTYPIGVSGYMYGQEEILAMFKLIDFVAPNSLESEMQNFIHLFKKRTGLCTNEAVSVCVHDNLTQTEIDNKILGNFTIQELLDLWNDGKEINVSSFYNQPATVSQELVYEFIDRDEQG